MEKVSDQILIEKYKQTNNQEYLSAFYEKHTGLVFGICLKYLQSSEEAKDAVMDIYEKLAVDIPRFEIQNIKSWLYSFTKNHCLMILRKEKSIAGRMEDFRHEQNFFMENDSHMHPNIENDEIKAKFLEECMKILKESQKKCLELFYFQDYCYQQIADKTAYDLKKVKSYIQNGKRNLKICIEEKYAASIR